MTAKVRACVELRGHRLRYAEVAHTDSGYRLLRLGDIDFAFDLEQGIFGERVFVHRDALFRALQDVLGQSRAPYLHVVIPPGHGLYFFVPQDASLTRTEREERLLKDLQMIAGEEAAGLYHVSVARSRQEVREQEELVWFHVYALSQQIHARFNQLMDDLPFTKCHFFTSMQAASHIVRNRLKRLTQGEPAIGLSLGCYEGYTEFVLCQGEEWIFAHDEPVIVPEDVVYYAFKVLEQAQIEPQAVQQVGLYGDSIRPEVTTLLEQLLGKKPERLDPLEVVGGVRVPSREHVQVEALVPCIGAGI